VSVGDDRISQLVVIGSSAGGIDALSAVLRTLPATMQAPVLVAQHLDPNRPSHLTEILRRQTSLRVETVTDHAPLEASTVLVIPPGRHAEVTDREIRLSEVTERGPRPSIDLLFSSAAQVFGEGLIAVILTGTGHDGAAGAKDVKAFGGTVVVQNPATASYPGMPLAVAPTSIDVVAELDAIGPVVHELLAGVSEPRKPDEERLLRSFLGQLRDRTGIDFGSYKRATILRRLQRRMVATATTSLRDYIRFARNDPGELQRLTSSFLIKVTEFFRDKDLFDELRDVVIPGLIGEARDGDRVLRLWSAGCATGEEAYSLAMIVADALGDELASFNVRIFATDVDAEAIAFARRGIYPEAALADLPEDVIERHFTKLADGYEVKKRIRAITVFGQHDLAQRAPFPRVDLALCRNVLIYFTTDLQKRALQLFAFALREGGYLALGKAESTTPLAEHFVLAHPRLRIYRRHGDRVMIPATRIRDSARLAPIRPAARTDRPGWIGSALARSRELPHPPTAAEKAEAVLQRLPIGVVVIDRSYDIESINGAARVLLGIHGAAIGKDLVHLVPRPVAEAYRTVIDAAFRGESADAAVSVPIATTGGTDVRWVHLAAKSSDDDPKAGGADVVTLLVDDVSAGVERVRELEEALARERAEREQVDEHSRQVADSNVRLLAANNELTIANAELHSTNEELLVANEEVQAATEEVETLNEELQATNEELETLNEELQATVEELNTTNDDLQARNLEILASTDPTDPAFRRLIGAARRIMESETAVAVVGPDPDLDLANTSFRAIFDGTTICDGDDGPIAADDQPLARARRGERFEMTVIVQRGRRKIGRFVVKASPIGPPGGPVSVEALPES
jgi:two-component system CheB/CheR fusion protein